MDDAMQRLDKILEIHGKFDRLIETAYKMVNTEFALLTGSQELVQEGLPERAEAIQRRILVDGIGLIERLLEECR